MLRCLQLISTVPNWGKMYEGCIRLDKDGIPKGRQLHVFNTRATGRKAGSIPKRFSCMDSGYFTWADEISVQSMTGEKKRSPLKSHIHVMGI